MLELYCNFHNIFLCENSFRLGAEFWVKVAKWVDSYCCLIYWPTRIGALNNITKIFSVYNSVCVFYVYFTTRFLSWPQWRKLITNVLRLWMALWNSVIFLIYYHLFTWNCSEIFSNFIVIHIWVGMIRWVCKYFTVPLCCSENETTLITLFGCVFNMTDVIMMPYVVHELWILNAWTCERKCFSFYKNGWHNEFS
jgi:hypothetical protein